MMRSFRGNSWRWLTAVVVGAVLLAGGTAYAFSHNLVAGLATSLPGSAMQQTTPGAPTPVAAAPASGTMTAGQASPFGANSRRIVGEVIKITPEPASFTLRTPEGAETTFRVLPTTIFAAGPDRPYNFGLLKVGDQVGVRDGNGANAQANPNAGNAQAQAGNAQASAANVRPGAGGAGRGFNANPARAIRPADGTLVARQVLVRPAGETGRRRPAQAAARPNSVGNGGSNVTGQ